MKPSRSLDGPRSSSPRPGLLLLLGVVVGASPSASGQSSAPASSASQVHALARLKPASGLVTVGSRPGARIVKILVAPGDEVKEGQTLAILEGRDQALAQVALAEIQKAQADHQRDLKKKTWDLERSSEDQVREARLKTATTVAETLRKKLTETSGVYNTLGGALTGRDKIEADSRYMELQIQTLKAELDRDLLNLEKTLVVAKRALEDEQLDPAKNPELGLADGQVKLARAAVEQTEVVAPTAGKILDVIGHPGEVGTGQLLQMGDVSKMVAEAEVFQEDVAKLHPGDPAQVMILGKPVSGKVTRIGTVVGRNQAANMDPRALRDVRVVKVTIALDDPTAASTLIDMEADAAITPGASR